MKSLQQKVDAYKRGVINNFKPFVVNGQLTATELEFIANGAVIENFEIIKEAQ